ncbi:MAG: parallel beta-helix repeat-containing protein [archaeon GW2011_AR3]|nr:MAG: parallel beta-helix repeat-containing protein [archaeon GW2011_AR3]MBS3109629.1 PGF-pre-PGF domain-containing protein [Candidatus Woesearchaeota archaeon]
MKNKAILPTAAILIALLLAYLAMSDSVTSPSVSGANISGTYTFNCTIDSINNATNVSFYMVNSTNTMPLGVDYNTSHSEGSQNFYNITYNTNTLGSGSYTLYCNASNASLATASVSRPVTVDYNAPSVTINLPTAKLYNTSTLILNVSASDLGTGAYTVTYRYRNLSNDILSSFAGMTKDSSNYWILDFTSIASTLDDGNYSFDFNATDFVALSGNSSVWGIAFDRSIPNVDYSSASSSDGANQTSAAFNVNVTANDSSSIATVTLILDGLSNASLSGTGGVYSVRKTLATEGTYTYYVRVNDSAGNVNVTGARTISYDNTAPVINISNPANASTVANSYFNVSVNVTELLPNSTFCSYNVTNADTGATVRVGSLDAAGYASLSGTSRFFTITPAFTQLTDGNHTINVTCKDMLGKQASAKNYVTVADTTGPVISNVDSSSTSTSGTISWTTDEDSTSEVICGTVTNPTASCKSSATYTDTHSLTVSDLDSGTKYYYLVKSCDLAGTCTTSSPAGNFTTASIGSSSSSSSSSSSGGGGGDTTEASSVTQVWDSVPPGVLISKAISNTNIPVTKVSFTLATSASNAELKITGLTSRPGSATEPETTAYKYFEITKTNIPDVSLATIEIEFTVTRKWITDNNIDEAKIALLRWVNSAWAKLETKAVKSTSTEVTFSAKSPGFSYFAISGEAAATTEDLHADAAAETDDTAQNASQEDIYETLGDAPAGDTATGTGQEETAGSGQETTDGSASGSSRKALTWIIIIAVILVIAAALIYFVYGRRGSGGFGLQMGKESESQSAHSFSSDSSERDHKDAGNKEPPEQERKSYI